MEKNQLALVAALLGFCGFVFAAYVAAGDATRRQVQPAEPWPNNSLGLHLMLDQETVAYGRPYGPTANLECLVLNNSPWRLLICPKYSFYAKQETDVEMLRVIEKQAFQGIHGPYGRHGMKLSLQAPSRPGRWTVFLEMVHSPLGHSRWTQDTDHEKVPETESVSAQDRSTASLWTGKVRSNEIELTFRDLSADERMTRDRFIEHLREAGEAGDQAQ